MSEYGTGKRKDKHGFVYPWWSEDFIRIIENWNMKNMKVFEWGSGYSTLWFANRCEHITSIEYDKKWFNLCKEFSKKFSIDNKITMHLIDYADGTDRYVNSIDMTNDIYDVIIIDGRNRCSCANSALKHCKSGTLIILDDSQRDNYQPVKDIYDPSYLHFESLPDKNGKTTTAWIYRSL